MRQHGVQGQICVYDTLSRIAFNNRPQGLDSHAHSNHHTTTGRKALFASFHRRIIHYRRLGLQFHPHVGFGTPLADNLVAGIALQEPRLGVTHSEMFFQYLSAYIVNVDRVGILADAKSG
jgi:hypothetical protein